MRLITVAIGLWAFASTGTAFAGPITEKLRACLAIEDMTKERLDCYDAIVRPEPKAKPPVAKIVTDCRYLKEEDERLICFNRFVICQEVSGANKDALSTFARRFSISRRSKRR